VDLTHPIRSVVPSLAGPVLQALAQSNAPASLTELHQRAGDGSLSGVRKVLELFAVEGIVLRSAAGYQLNRDHLAFPAITLLATLRTCFNDRVREWAAQHPDHVRAVGVFGSMARRDGGSDSDIDLLVIATDQADRDALRDELSERVAAWTGNQAQVFTLTARQLAQMRHERDPLFVSWKQDLQLLSGDREQVFG